MILRNLKDKSGKTDIDAPKVTLQLSDGSKFQLEESPHGDVLSISSPGQMVQFGVVNNAILIRIGKVEEAIQ